MGQPQGSGETDHLAANIMRLSIVERQGLPVHNSQSEDTVYSRLVKERQAFEQNNKRQDKDAESDLSRATANNKEGSSLDSSNTNGSTNISSDLTDQTDKEIVMQRFVTSPLRDHDNQINNDLISENDCSPSPKRRKNNAERQKKKITVAEYEKRKLRESKREEE